MTMMVDLHDVIRDESEVIREGVLCQLDGLIEDRRGGATSIFKDVLRENCCALVCGEASYGNRRRLEGDVRVEHTVINCELAFEVLPDYVRAECLRGLGNTIRIEMSVRSYLSI